MTAPEDLNAIDAAEMMRRFAHRQRSRLVVEIDIDPVPGWGDNAEDHRRLVESLLSEAVPHYNPTVEVAQ